MDLWYVTQEGASHFFVKGVVKKAIALDFWFSTWLLKYGKKKKKGSNSATFFST